jgi:CBS domain-containing protein
MLRGPGKDLMQGHIRSVMHGHLVTAAPTDSLLDVASQIAAHGISAVPVVDAEHRLLGIVSTSDVVNLLHDGTTLDGKSAGDVMTRDPISIDEFATAGEAIGVMRNALIRHLPVTREGRLVGMVTTADLIRHLLQDLDPEVA